jgi:hypothetical protein
MIRMKILAYNDAFESYKTWEDYDSYNSLVEENFYEEDSFGDYNREITRDMFFGKYGLECKFCNSPLYTPVRYRQVDETLFTELLTVHNCVRCGWWYAQSSEEIYCGEEEFIGDALDLVGILRQYALNDLAIPINALRNELTKHTSILYQLNPTKLEELVGSVLKDFFYCNVSHVGRSGDGGVDLILLDGEEQILIQVKRRSDSRSKEGVRVVRELLGSLFFFGQRQGMIVTTAERFTSGAHKLVQDAQKRGLIGIFDLIDYPRFVDLLKLTSQNIIPPWEEYLKSKGLFVGELPNTSLESLPLFKNLFGKKR